MILPGEIYEDCAFPPVLCLRVDEDEVQGVSLIDGSQPRSCSLVHCGVVRLSVDDVIDIKADFDVYVARRRVELDRGGQP